MFLLSRTTRTNMVVGKLTFDRKLMGRMVKRRDKIEEIGVALNCEEFPTTFQMTVVGSEEAVSRSVSLILELADGCGFYPGNHTSDNYPKMNDN